MGGADQRTQRIRSRRGARGDEGRRIRQGRIEPGSSIAVDLDEEVSDTQAVRIGEQGSNALGVLENPL
jgi:hypothetical protein